MVDLNVLTKILLKTMKTNAKVFRHKLLQTVFHTCPLLIHMSFFTFHLGKQNQTHQTWKHNKQETEGHNTGVEERQTREYEGARGSERGDKRDMTDWGNMDTHGKHWRTKNETRGGKQDTRTQYI